MVYCLPLCIHLLIHCSFIPLFTTIYHLLLLSFASVNGMSWNGISEMNQDKQSGQGKQRRVIS